MSLLDQAAHGACTMIRAKFLKKLGGYNESYTCQDGYELWVKFTRNYKIRNINVPLFYYRQHGNNLTANEQRILQTRARINSSYIEAQEESVRTVGIIPVRGEQNSIGFQKIGDKQILKKKIEDAVASKHLLKVVVTGNSDFVENYVKDNFEKEPKVVFVRRSKRLARLNVNLGRSIDNVLKTLDPYNEIFNSIALLTLEFPFLSTFQIDDAINTMFLFGSDSLISVRSDNSLYFQHHGEGMVPILNQDKFTKLEREALYRNVGGITVVKRGAFDKGKGLLTGRVGHIIIDQKASHGIFSKLDLEIAKYLYKYED